MSHLTDQELRHRRRFFWLFYSRVNKILIFLIPVIIRLKPLFLFTLPLVRYTLKHFYGGFSLKESLPKINNLHRANIATTLDYCVENSQSSDHGEAILQELTLA
ncbi:MAG: hypothetical protein OXC40_04665, partial [Proteobacteria bacterium]|nr:hypothetical protein [Pseudomonadota bacterium]